MPWNFGAKIGPKRPLNQRKVRAIRFLIDREKRIRDRAQFDLAIDSKLRGCDVVELKIGDLVSGPDINKRARFLLLCSAAGRVQVYPPGWNSEVVTSTTSNGAAERD